jgi:ribonuclease D
MDVMYIDRPERADDVRRALEGRSSIALDSEAAGFHRYSDRVCLLQLSVPSGKTFLLDPLAFDPSELLRPVLEDPGVEVLMHGADYDLRLLDRDLGIRLSGLFDTQVAASLLGETGLGLSALLERHLGIVLPKKYQRADWAIRPLPEEMLEYAAGDTLHLHDLVQILREALEVKGRMAWAKEEFARLEEVRWEEADEDRDPVLRVKRAWELDSRSVARLREALQWRDAQARARDRAPFRVAGDPALVLAAVADPGSRDDLARISGFPPALAHSPAGDQLLERFAVVDRLPAGDLVPHPPRERRGPGRPLPEEEELAERLKVARNRTAEALGLDRGTVLSNGIISEIARVAPTDTEGLLSIPGIRRWQVEVVGDDLLAVLRKGTARR